MSLNPESRTSGPGAGIHENHYCCIDGCGKWGGLGFSHGTGDNTTWWCARHYPHWPERIAVKYAAEDA